MHVRKLETKNAPDGGANLDQIKTAIEDHTASVAAIIKKQSEEIAKQTDRIDGMKAEAFQLEQCVAEQFARNHGIPVMGNKSSNLSHVLMNSQAWGSVANKSSAKTAIDVKTSDLLLESKSTTSYDTSMAITQRMPEIVTGPARRKFLRQRFRQVPVVGSNVEFHRILTYTNNAAPQGGGSPHVFEGLTKPESNIVFEAVERKIQTVAHWVKASKQVMGDAPMLSMVLDTQLRLGLELAIESQIITGNAAGSNFSGLTASGNYVAFTPTSGDTAIDSLSRAIAAIEAADGNPDLIIMHPTDFRSMQRLKSSGGGDFLFGAPNGSNLDAVWNRDIHITPAMTQGYFIAMDSALACAVFNREDASVQVGYEGSDFTKNLVTILAEARLALGVLAPSMIRYGALTL